MKDIGEKLKDARESIGVSIEEVADDLKLESKEIENIESGNSEAFKDVYNVKYLIRDYAKYLGLNKEDLVDEYNEYLFDYTSRLSLNDIKKAKKERSDAKRIKSPYTNIKKKYPKFWIAFYIVMIILICLIVYLILGIENADKGDFKEGSVVTEKK
ncbi:MAG: helix-turn-helix domain-containing protein [Bacilli bacterium]|nr:helix-turn-helix domain-containing protein [Bacilli bacterium]